MWTLLIFLNVGVLHCTVSSPPPSPINVVFSSVNLKNVLHWSPGNGTPNDTYFTVQYAIYGESVEGSKGKRVHWRAVRQCKKIVRTWCDLSNETWDLDNEYHARVRAVGRRASSNWTFTQRRFAPKLDTSFGPPLVSVEIEDNSAIITLKGPMRYQSNNLTPVFSMATFYHHMTYNLSIRNGRRGQTQNLLDVSSPYTYRLMDYDTEYCFSAKTRFLTMPIQCHSSEWLCIHTPQDPVIGQMQRVILGIVAPSLCMCVLMVVGYFLCSYLMGKGQKNPYILNPPSFHSAPLPFLEVENIILITIEPPLDTDPVCPPDLGSILRFADPPPRYSPQRPETPLEIEESCNDLSVDYGFVGVREEEDREKRNDRREDGNNLKGKCQRCVAEDSQFGGFYAPQAKPCLPLKSTHICLQTHMPIHTQTHAQTEMSTLAQAHALSQLNSVSHVDREKENSENPGLFLNKNPQTGLFHIPLNEPTNKEMGMGEDVEGKVIVRTDGKIDEGVEEGSTSEKVPLLSAYASQNMTDMPPFHTEQSDFLPDDYGVLRVATAHNIEEKNDDNYVEEEGTNCINWDPETGQLVLSEMVIQFNKQRGVNGLIQKEKGSEDRMGGEDEEIKETKDKLRLENVFVRQPSEEAVEAVKEIERGGTTGWEVDDFVTKWNLVIPVDQ